MRGTSFTKPSFIILAGLALAMMGAGVCAAGQDGWNNDGTAPAAPAHPGIVESMTVAGGPIWSKHFQSGDGHFNEEHTLATIRVNTNGYGNWGVYLLTPNSVDDTSVGAVWLTDPWVLPLGPTQLELTGGIGLVTGYRDYPVPMVSGTARLALYRQGPWNAGIEMAAMPYIAENRVTGENDAGLVATTPFLSIRYAFN